MIAANCDFSGRYMQAASTECMGYFSEFSGYTSNINIYDLYGICFGNDPYP